MSEGDVMSKGDIICKLHGFVDALETHYGAIEGFEVRLEHPIVDGKRQEFANIVEFSITYLHKTEIELE